MCAITATDTSGGIKLRERCQDPCCNEIRYLYTFVLMRWGLLAAFEIGTVTFRCFRCHGAQIHQTYEGAPVHKEIDIMLPDLAKYPVQKIRENDTVQGVPTESGIIDFFQSFLSYIDYND